MKVSELIELLEEQDPDAEVILQEQAGYPMEYALLGVTTRDEVLRAHRDELSATPSRTSWVIMWQQSTRDASSHPARRSPWWAWDGP